MKRILILILLTTLASCKFISGGGREPDKESLQKNLKIPGVTDENSDLKLVDFIQITYLKADISWKESSKNDWYLTIDNPDEMTNKTVNLKYHLIFRSSYVELTEASADGELLPQNIYVNAFIGPIMNVGKATGNKKLMPR